MNYYQIVREILFQNLKLLNLRDFLSQQKEKIVIDVDCLPKMSQKQFQAITYFLLSKLDAHECRHRYLACYPALDKRQESEFRQITCKWFEELVSNGTLEYSGRIAAIYFQNAGGEAFNVLYLQLSSVVLAIAHNAHPNHSPSTDLSQLVTQTFANLELYDKQLQTYNQSKQKWSHHFEHFKSDEKRLLGLLEDEENIKKQMIVRARDECNCLRLLDEQQFTDCLSELRTNVKQLFTKLSESNEQIDNKWSIFENVFQCETNSMDELLIDFSDLFKPLQTNCEDGTHSKNTIQVFYDRIQLYKNVLSKDKASNNVMSLLDISSSILNEANHYVNEMKGISDKLKEMIKHLEQEVKQMRENLLNNPIIIERYNLLRQSVPDITKIRFKFGLEYAPQMDNNLMVNNIDSNNIDANNKKSEDESPIFITRASTLNFSFQVADMSTYEYIPPNGPEDDSMFSPIKEEP